jgi:hypothetical protein
MIHITPEAHEKVLEAIEQNGPSLIRINEVISGGG